MRGKFAKTLLSRAHTQIHVAGQGAKGYETYPDRGGQRIYQHSIFRGARMSLGRLAAQWRYWRLLQRLAPSLVIVHAPELLPLTMLWQKLGPGRKFIYDIRENYALNISTQQVYRGLTRRWLAAGLRWVEGQAAHQAAAIILAEASYADELPFVPTLPSDRVLVLENKYQPAPGETMPDTPGRIPTATETLHLLYSGTISELNGVWEAIELTQQLHTAWPGGAHLTIVGFCQQPPLLRQIQEKVARHADWLTLVGGGNMVPHARIVAEINRSHLGLLPYRPHPSTERCRPTKLFEYLAHGLPVISSPNVLWRELLVKHQAGFQLDFTASIDGAVLAEQLQQANFYPDGMPTDVLWENEGKKLWLLLDSLR
ncbi:Glycosyltransferase involved in cell wall bisynthesis [Hymenobacter arizonensis]|uniref:Glycosyltransferase involved in cell wall bisynthesis n=2 Tax=Hymenobacter arizonensis TaxID=1227077 RepID=A0A1I5TU40_HYMAR|nr:Glycosyltransferase involved in cell wall bisynthesis [Hymenobacter arizonensis]